MSGASAMKRIRDRLRSAIESGRLPSGAADRGAQLLTRLNTPVSVIVAGLPQSGKTCLINMLAGQPVIPEGRDLPVVELAGGATARTVLVAGDGTQQSFSGNLLADDPGGQVASAALVRLELPLPALAQMSLTEIRVAGSPAEQRAALDLVARRADIALWCTEEFTDTEQALWADMPDRVKDHGFLILTKADRLLMKGDLNGHLARLQPVVAEEFHSLYPVATLRAIAARAGEGPDGGAQWQASGGRALAHAVAKQVATGRAADADTTLLFLNRCGETGAERDHPAPSSASTQPPIPDRAPRTTGAEAVASAPGLSPARAALDALSDRAADLLETLPAEDAGLAEYVLDHCVETVNALNDLLSAMPADDLDAAGLGADAVDGMDLLILLQLERTDDAAEDAVNVLIQMKKELAERAAAG